MSNSYQDEYKELGKKWLRGEVEIESFGDIKLSPKQAEFVNDKSRFSLVSGGMASGKTTAFIIKFILLTQWFPGTRILIGRRTKGNASSTFMKDFVDICPAGMYEHKVGEGKLVFKNGSEAVFFGLEAMQSGSGEDLKKAIQEIKSHNFGFILLDQLEEIEYKVFEALNSRTRRRSCRHDAEGFKIVRDKDGLPLYEVCGVCDEYTFNQFLMTTNPANFWGYDFFKKNPRPMTHLVECSMLDNKSHLSEQFIQSELAKPKRYVQKYVFGEWSPDSMTEGGVFYEEYIREQAFYIKDPIREFDGIKMWEEPMPQWTYQIGVDPSEGSVDPCSIKVFCVEKGEEVAAYHGFVNSETIIKKILQLAYLYSPKEEALVVIESNSMGAAVIEGIKKQWPKLYQRETFNYREQKNIKKLGFQTNHQSKSLLIEHFQLLLSQKTVKIRDKDTREEMQVFVYSDEASKSGAGAQTGYHDDRVMATMLACWRLNPVEQRKETQFNENTQQKVEQVRMKKSSNYI